MSQIYILKLIEYRFAIVFITNYTFDVDMSQVAHSKKLHKTSHSIYEMQYYIGALQYLTVKHIIIFISPQANFKC